MRRVSFLILRVIVLLAAIILLSWFVMLRMPGTNVSSAVSLSPDELRLREELKSDVQKIAGDIGERNLQHYDELNATAQFIEKSFSDAGLKPQRITYEVRGKLCHNIETEIPGRSRQIVLIGAHYDSVSGAPGANDNGSGVAALLALAKRFAGKTGERALRLVAFVNEEPPCFQTSEMGSLVYAGRCKERNDRITAMISLETIGFFSDAPDSQVYPAPGLGAFYPSTANFIGFVGNTRSRALLRRVITSFRAQQKLPSEGSAMPSFIPGIGWSDHWAFWQHGYPAIMVTDTALFRYPHYHAATDTPDKLDYDRFTLVVSGMEKVIQDLVAR